MSDSNEQSIKLANGSSESEEVVNDADAVQFLTFSVSKGRVRCGHYDCTRDQRLVRSDAPS